MTYNVISLLLNIFVTGLLGVTIFFCLKLNRRIRVLQDSKSELAQLIEKFDLSTQQATVSIQEIHKASKKINENIQVKLDKANYLADDLAFMIEKANKMADRMEGGISSSRNPVTRSAPQQQVDPRVRAAREEPKEDLTQDNNSLAEKIAARNRKPAEAGNAGKSLDTMMERLSELQGKSGNTPGGGKKVSARPRSRSEQELMEALKTETKA